MESQRPTRASWEQKASVSTLIVADMFLRAAQHCDPGLQLKYGKFSIQLDNSGQVNSMAICRPSRNWIIVEIKLPRRDDLDSLLNRNGIQPEYYTYKGAKKFYALKLFPETAIDHEIILVELLHQAFDVWKDRKRLV